MTYDTVENVSEREEISMLVSLFLGSMMTILNLGFQVVAVSILVRYFTNRLNDSTISPSTINDSKILSVVMMVLFVGHIGQFATWAALFIWLGEFQDFKTSFYHSTVNFASLGYGDIVMSEDWRLLGALEACNGVLMFGLSVGTIMSVMNGLFRWHKTS